MKIRKYAPGWIPLGHFLKPYVAISGMCGGDGTMAKKAVSVRGKAENIGADKLPEVFEQNPYMAEINPQEESLTA